MQTRTLTQRISTVFVQARPWSAPATCRFSFQAIAVWLILGSFASTTPLGASSLVSETPATFELAGPPQPIIPPDPRVARLGKIPDWSRLDAYQEKLTREEFVYLLDHCYSRTPEEHNQHIRVVSDRAYIVKQSNHPVGGWYELRFRTSDSLSLDGPRYWRKPTELRDIHPNSTRPLEGLHVAVDPGHIGGDWVRWDDRHFSIIKDTIEVREGEMNLRVAKILERDLSLLGARVTLTREENAPVTEERVETLEDEARSYLLSRRKVPSAGLIASTTKAMFAISSEIRTRSEILNTEIQPDIALCLHFNASPWGSRPSFRQSNHLHILINGCYSAGEIAEDDTRLEMLLRILQRVYYEEVAISDEIIRSMKSETRLPAFAYDGSNGMSVNENGFLWARNLLANRVFMCPVIFFEPYCMNHREIYERVQMGEYPGLREVNGIYRKNIYQEYADGVTAGLVRYYRGKR
ncbi:MAG: hypothetical protein AAF236_00530 [Verrucomicrobiota bacterium]